MMDGLAHRVGRAVLVAAAVAVVIRPAVTEAAVTFVGAAFGTTYRVVLAADIPGYSTGEVHREVEELLRGLDMALSTWRSDSDASRFNRALAGEWVEVGDDLVEVLRVSRRVHDASDGAFDPTAAPLVRLWASGPVSVPGDEAIDGARSLVGMNLVEWRASDHGDDRSMCPSMRKRHDGVTIDLSGIGPGYAVDRIGERLRALGSLGHLVVLGGEARAWGRRADESAWSITVGSDRVVMLADGEAVATSTVRPGRSPVDPRSGRPVVAVGSWSVRADSCAEADAWAVAAVVLGLVPEKDGLVDRRTNR